MASRKAKWERLWQVENERPPEELSTVVPRELKESVDSGWLAPGSAVMDIGSGGGQISAWLVAHGFEVVGVDLAGTATELARRRFGHLGPSLEFRTLDICNHTPQSARFDAFVDRGCFHLIGVSHGEAYARNIATWARKGAHFLLFHKVDHEDGSDAAARELDRTALERRMRRTFEPWFVMDRAVRAVEPMVRSAGPIPRDVRPGMVFWFTRR
jgi:cyclopropane fatty-acyl-phospholipid synthase-like methyltransferase